MYPTQIDIRNTQCVKYDGSGNPKDICILFMCNGIGDLISLMPALWQKKQDGYNIQLWTRSFGMQIFAQMGIDVVDGSDDVGSLGLMDILQAKFGAVYDMYKFLLKHDDETEGELTKSRFLQCADILETTLPKEFDFRSFFPSYDQSDYILFAPRSYAKQRSYGMVEEAYDLLNAHYDTHCIGMFMQEELSYDDFIREVGSARCVVSVDTGVLLFALALGVPTIALMGPTDEWNIVYPFGKWMDLANVKVVRSDSIDRSCKRPCSFQGARGYGVSGKCTQLGQYSDCLNEIHPEEIVKNIKLLLKEN